MLARARRIVNPLEFKRVVRRGRRATGSFMTIYVTRSDATAPTHAGPARSGFVVSKAVGGAVTRNLVKRRLRAILHETSLPTGTDLVLRAHPSSAEATYTDLSAEFTRLLRKAWV